MPRQTAGAVPVHTIRSGGAWVEVSKGEFDLAIKEKLAVASKKKPREAYMKNGYAIYLNEQTGHCGLISIVQPKGYSYAPSWWPRLVESQRQFSQTFDPMARVA